MRSLMRARTTCERIYPGLLAQLETMPLHEREADGSPVIEIFRRYGGPGLLVPREYGGQQADPLDAVCVQRALAAVSPSLGVATVMHHFTVAMLFTLAARVGRLTPAQLKTLSAVAGDGLLLASGWAEGRADRNILVPAVVAERTSDGYRVNGAKKPCSLSRSMDLLTASVEVTDHDGRPALALLLIPAGSPGVTVHDFWSTPVLAGAQSHEVRLENVDVPADLAILSTLAGEQRLDDLQTAGFTWFELLTTAAYTGVASALAARVVASGRGRADERLALSLNLEAAIDLVEGQARAMTQRDGGDDAVAGVLVARYASQDLLAATADRATEMLGGMAFISSFDVAYLASAVRALAFHPPSRASVAAEFGEYFEGKPLRLS